MNKILIVVAHPDDAILACGASAAKHARAGDEVHLLALADGIMGRAGPPKESRAPEFAAHKRAAEEAHAILGLASFTQCDFPDGRLDTVARLELIQPIQQAVDQRRPDTVYTHFPGDLNSDHVRVAKCVSVACRPVKGCSVETLCFFEVPSSTEWRPPAVAEPFAPNWFVDVSETLDLKMRALEAYDMEMRQFPHPRSLEAVTHLARWRGATAGVEAAEAFVLARRISK